MNVIKTPLAAWLLGLALITNLQAAETITEARDVEVKLVLVDVDEVNNVKQSFTANVALTLRWQDKNLAHEGPNSISKSLTDIWYPSIQILNQQRVVETFPRIVEIQPDGVVLYRQRYWGVFSQPMELSLFPFDIQSLKLTLANIGFGMQFVSLIPSKDSGVHERFSMPDWEVTGWEFVNSDLPFEEDAGKVKGMVFSLDVKRDTGYFKYKVILPLVLIVMMSWMVFWQGTMNLLEIVKYNGSFSFKYSDRPGTKAQQLDLKIPEEIKSPRLQRFQKRQDEISLEKNRSYVGKTLKILVEKVTDENMVGRTVTNHIVHIGLKDQKHTINPGDYIDVAISFAGQHSLKGDLLNSKTTPN